MYFLSRKFPSCRICVFVAKIYTEYADNFVSLITLGRMNRGDRAEGWEIYMAILISATWNCG
jgi:hypothetical protein